MSVTATDVKTLGGTAFASLSDETVNTWISLALRRLSESVFGDDYDDAVTFWTLHQLAQSSVMSGSAGGAGGSVTSMSVGSVSVSYGSVANSNESNFSSTSWGRLFLDIANTHAPGIMVANYARPC